MLKNILMAIFILAQALSFLSLSANPACAVGAHSLHKITDLPHTAETVNFVPQSISVLIFLIVLLVVIPRRYILLVFILSTVLIPRDQRFIIHGLNFTALRILILVGAARLAGRRLAWNNFDLAVIGLALLTAGVYILLHKGGVVYRSGILLDTIGIYWVFRNCISDWNDVKFLIKWLGIAALVSLPFVIIEHITGVDPFRMFSTAVHTIARYGKWRCSASFVHPIVLGTFWALAMPLFYGMLRISRHKIFYGAVLCASLFMIFASHSSTPIGVLIAEGILIFLFSKRYSTKIGIGAFLILLVILHFICLALLGMPVWALLGMAKFTSFSESWYRYYLFDSFIKHFKDWFWLGAMDTGPWAPFLKTLPSTNQLDPVNQYVFEGVTGGIWSLLLFLGIIGSGARILITHYQKAVSHEGQFLSWCFAVSLAGFIVGFFGISLYGQLNFLWYLLLAVIALIYGEQRIRPGSFKERVSWMCP